jgi:ribonuclease PH
LRPIKITPNIIKNADGSVLYHSGNTEVICTASFESKVPDWLQDSGWITAEYSMLPASTNSRVTREITRGKKNARSQEIQRLIGRALRGAANLKEMAGISIYVDCDVINADGGTRTASINGGFVAIALALKNKYPDLYKNNILNPVGAISVGKVNGKIVDDLDYDQDSSADVDLNIVMNSSYDLIEIQGTGENGTFNFEELNEMLTLGKSCISKIFTEQEKILS